MSFDIINNHVFLIFHDWLISDKYNTSVSYQIMSKLFWKLCTHVLQQAYFATVCIFQGQILTLNIYITLHSNIY